MYEKCQLRGQENQRVLVTKTTLQGEEETVRQLLSDGANPNSRDNAGWTPLVHYYYYCTYI